MRTNLVIAALTLACVSAFCAAAVSSLDPQINNAQVQLKNAQAQLQNLNIQQQSLHTTQSADKRIEADNRTWLAAEPGNTTQANGDIANQKAARPALADKLKSLTDTDAQRAETSKAAAEALTAAKGKLTKLHDDALAAFLAVDPGKTAYGPVKATKEKLTKDLADCEAALERTPAYREALATQKAAAAALVNLRKGNDLGAIAQASQADMTAGNDVEKMRSAAFDNSPTLRADSQGISTANAAFKPTLDAFEADLLTQADYAAAQQEATDAQNIVTLALAAQMQAAADELAARKQIADLDSKAGKATQLIKSSAAESARRSTQNANIDRELQSIDQETLNLDVLINNARINVAQCQQQYNSLVAQRRAAGG
jgi:chromosome segregation ATPase